MSHIAKQYIQEYFQIRSGDTVGLNVDSGWAAAENTNATIAMGTTFRIRFKVRETAGGDFNNTFKLQYNHESGGWNDVQLFSTGGPSIAPVLCVLSSQYANDDATSTELLTSTTTYVNGLGMEDDITGTVVISSQETELEWALQIQRFIDDGSAVAVDDTIEFRVVEGTGTVFAGTYTNPTITVSNGVGYVGGIYAETPTHIGPFIDTNDNIYFILELGDSVSINPTINIIKSTDGGDSWAIMDYANIPSEQDLEGIDVFQDGDTLWIAHFRSSEVFLHEFNTSDHSTNADKWGTVDETIEGALTVTGDQKVVIIGRSDSTLVCFYNEQSVPARVHYKIRSSGGTWGSEISVDTEASTSFLSVEAVLGESETIHIFYKDTTNGILYHRTLSSGDSLSGRQTVKTGMSTGTGDPIHQIPPVYYDDSGVEVIAIGYQTAATAVIVRYLRDGTLQTEATATDNDVAYDGGGSGQIIASMGVYQKEVHLFYSEESTFDIFRDENDGEGGWGYHVQEVHDGVTCHWIRGRVIVNPDGDTVFGYFWDNGSDGVAGQIWYDEYLIAAASVDTKLTAAQGDYTLTGKVVDLLYGRHLDASQGSYSLTGQAVTFALGYIITAAQGDYTLTGQDVDLLRTYQLDAVQGSYSLSGQVVNLLVGKLLDAAQGDHSLTGQISNLLFGRYLEAVQGDYSLNGQDVGFLVDRLLTAVQGSYALNGQDVTFSKGRLLTAAYGSYALTGQPVSFLHNRQLTAAQGDYSLTGQAANLLVSRLLTAAQGSYSLNGQAVNFLLGIMLTAEQGGYSLTGQAASLIADRLLTATQGSYALTGQDADLIYTPVGSHTLIAAQGSYALTGQIANLLYGRHLDAVQGSYAQTGQAANLLTGYLVSAAQGSYSLSGQATNTLVGRLLTAAQGSYALTGYDANLIYSPVGGYIIIAGYGSYALSGQTADLLYGRKLAASQGSYTLTGQSSQLLFGRLMASSYGSYALTGQAAELFYNRLLEANQGSYVLTGQDAGLLAARIFTVDHGNFNLTGQTSNLLYGRNLSAAQGSYVLTGFDIITLLSRVLAASQGSYVLTGFQAGLSFSGEIIPEMPLERIFLIGADNRIYPIRTDGRLYEILNDSRVFPIKE